MGFGSSPGPAPQGAGGNNQLLDDTWNSVSQGLSRLTVAASSVASATVATVKPGLQEVSQRYQRGELAESASSLLSTGADLGMKGLTGLKGLLKTAVSQIDGYTGAALAEETAARPAGQPAPARRAASAGWDGWDSDHSPSEAAAPPGKPQAAAAQSKVPPEGWAGWDAATGPEEISDAAWEADWGKVR